MPEPNPTQSGTVTDEDVINGLIASRDFWWRKAAEKTNVIAAARDALLDPNAMAEDTDSPANIAFAILNHHLEKDA